MTMVSAQMVDMLKCFQYIAACIVLEMNIQQDFDIQTSINWQLNSSGDCSIRVCLVNSVTGLYFISSTELHI